MRIVTMLAFMTLLLSCTSNLTVQEQSAIPEKILRDIDVHSILIEELGNLAIESYEFAKKYGLVKSGPITMKPSTAGIELVGKILKEETFEILLELNCSREDAPKKFRTAILNCQGSKAVKDLKQEQYHIVSGVIGSGYMNLNPAVIIVVIFEENGQTKAIIKAVAKEGLIKQQTAQKAVNKILQKVNE